MSESPTRQELHDLFETHLARTKDDERPDTNHFVEVVFESPDGESPNIQYQWGMLNLAGLSSLQKAACMDLVESRELLLRSEGPNYVTVEDVTTESPDELVSLIEQILENVYETTIADVAAVRERAL